MSLYSVRLHLHPLPFLAQLIRVSTLKLENEALEPLVRAIYTLANIKGSSAHQREVKLGLYAANLLQFFTNSYSCLERSF